ncbi:MAG TPA: SDR family NAD(P)-dependent oxidoreductase [Candidatus Sulfotelmatobacter sp.]|jgi:NAD(P)-dependent dehydrogenase (short-subunit alcohol dehydrogenase family)|nr:SDR family NAD(P)-dependent oxidoreductase [Candidatus Sulfotelmatobacter sp.]
MSEAVERRLEGRIALITGASRGIGAAVAKRFAAEGAQVILLARTQAALEEVDDEIRSAGGKATLVPLDLRKPDDIDRMGYSLFQRFGKLDILVGNAGVLGGLSPVGHQALREWDEVMAVNLSANMRLIRSFDNLLRQSDAGRAIFTTSGVTNEPHPFWGSYAASKSALETLVLTWAAEVARNTKLKVNLVDPGVVRTRLRVEAFPGEDQATLATPESVADCYVDLASANCPHHGKIIRAQ